MKVLRNNVLTHGFYGHPIYTLYYNMKQRCYNPNFTSYEIWGGRGITVCDEWLKGGVKVFGEWALANGWKKGLALDRIDTNGNYTPENCRFVPQIVNCRNQRSNRINEQFAEVIRSLYQQGKTRQEIAKENNLDWKLVDRVVNNISWAKLPDNNQLSSLTKSS